MFALHRIEGLDQRVEISLLLETPVEQLVEEVAEQRGRGALGGGVLVHEHLDYCSEAVIHRERPVIFEILGEVLARLHS